jgi:hypothetical protein
VTETLSVAINRDRIHAVDVPPSFEVTDSFLVRIENHGSATHVHLHLDDALSRVASLATDNHYVESQASRDVVVRVADGPRPAEGTLEVVTGYGAETARVAIDVVEPERSETAVAVAVDETMAEPPTAESRDAATSADTVAGVSRESVPVLALAGVAVTFAVLAAVISDALAVLLGVVAVAAGVGAAWTMLREE